MQSIIALVTSLLLASVCVAAPAPEPRICSLKQKMAGQGLCLYEADRSFPFYNENVEKAISKEDILKSNPQVPATDTSFTQSAVYFLPCDPAKTKVGDSFRGIDYLKNLCQA